MATTTHQQVIGVKKISPKTKAKLSNLKQAAHQGKTPVKDARTAPSGFASVPVSAAALPPGQGPPMSSPPVPAARGATATSARSARNVAALQQIFSPVHAGRGQAASSPPKRGKRKRGKK